MENDKLLFELCNKESDFIHNYGVNVGYQMSTQKIDRCLFLSSEAKQLYRNICHYAYGSRRDCFPSQTLLRMELGWGKNTITSYLKELTDSGLIRCTKKGFNKPLLYSVVELNKVNVLYHSEIVYSIIPKGSSDLTAFAKKLEEYRKSDLYLKVQQSEDPTKYREEIIKWFSDEEPEQQEPVPQEPEQEEPEQEEREETQETTPRIRMVTIPPDYDEVGGDSPKSRKKKPKASTLLEEWNARDFIDYFKRRHLELLGTSYYGNSAEDIVFMSNVVKSRKDNGVVKEFIDLYLTKAEVFKSSSVKSFSSAFVQQALDIIFRTGSVPEYLLKKKVAKDEAITDTDFNDLKG